MSTDTQLNRILLESQRLKEELDHSKNIMLTSQATKDLIEYAKKPDPLSPESGSSNPWTENKGGSCTLV